MKARDEGAQAPKTAAPRQTFFTRCPKCGQKMHLDLTTCPRCGVESYHSEFVVYAGTPDNWLYSAPVNDIRLCLTCPTFRHLGPCSKCAKFGLVKFKNCALCANTEPARYNCCKSKVRSEIRILESGIIDKELEDVCAKRPELKKTLLAVYSKMLQEAREGP